jgi:hypothetical protein
MTELNPSEAPLLEINQSTSYKLEITWFTYATNTETALETHYEKLKEIVAYTIEKLR